MARSDSNQGGPYQYGSIPHLRSLFEDLKRHVDFSDWDNAEEVRAICNSIEALLVRHLTAEQFREERDAAVNARDHASSEAYRRGFEAGRASSQSQTYAAISDINWPPESV